MADTNELPTTKGNDMNSNDAIILARKHLGKGSMDSSARLCLQDAIACQSCGYLDFAKSWAIKSLSYSVGIFHADYQRASKDSSTMVNN